MTDRLSLIQWLSPAFPTGGFAYSHGLEWAIDAGQIRDAAALTDWLTTILRHGAGWQDAVLLCHALDPSADLDALTDLAAALQPSSERLQETLDQGTALAQAVSALRDTPLKPRPLPIALGEAARGLALPPEEIAAHYLHAFASNLVSGAVRFVPLGQNAGQRALHALHPVIADVAARATGVTLDDLGTAALWADMAAMRHETMQVRIFRT
ncbi:urease accessory protein UreF [Mesobacterium pallidum]|uniref:urease accessory protein UreF n=1 Tax=Mesobacterium pallidum TaxID=2872037 RepID=UPI001EE28658|nr:urease accessory protein UreF [Mesobacterium pallidum]